MDMDKLDQYAKEHGDKIYEERMEDIYNDIKMIRNKASLGLITWKEACAEMEKEKEFYFGKAKLMEKFAHIVDDIDAVMQSEKIDKKLSVDDYEYLINKICDFDYSDYNEQIAELIKDL